MQIAETYFVDGLNNVRLVVNKADGTSEQVNVTVNIEREQPTDGGATQPPTTQSMCIHIIILLFFYGPSSLHGVHINP